VPFIFQGNAGSILQSRNQGQFQNAIVFSNPKAAIDEQTRIAASTVMSLLGDGSVSQLDKLAKIKYLADNSDVRNPAIADYFGTSNTLPIWAVETRFFFYARSYRELYKSYYKAYPADFADVAEKRVPMPPVVQLMSDWSGDRAKRQADYMMAGYRLSPLDRAHLERLDPKTHIIVHITAGDSLNSALNVFNSATPDANSRLKDRPVNVSTHFVIDRDANMSQDDKDKLKFIFQLTSINQPVDTTTGYPFSLNIEMVAKNNVTDLQLEMVAWLVAWLKQEFPTINFLFGHGEGYDRNSEAFKTFYHPRYRITEDNSEVNTNYPYRKDDPGMLPSGIAVMDRLRAIMLNEWGMTFRH
jgi:hypothetical protein